MGWLAAGVRAVRLEEDAAPVIQQARAGSASPAAVAQARDSLRKAMRFNADQGPMLREGELLGADGHAGEAVHAGERVVADEPDNLQGWFLIWASTQNHGQKRRALGQLRRLNPWIDIAIGLRDCLECPLKNRGG